MAADQRRTAWIAAQGITLLRFDNRQVLLETKAVLAVIDAEVRRRLRSMQ